MIDLSLGARRLRVTGVALIFIAALLFLASVALLALNFRDAAIENAYRAAIACSSPSGALNGQSCRYVGPATVVGTSRDNLLSLRLEFDGLTGHTFIATFPKDSEPVGTYTAVGGKATGELWNGHVVRFASAASTDDPLAQPKNLIVGVVFFAAGGTLLLVWGLQFRRASLLAARAKPTQP